MSLPVQEAFRCCAAAKGRAGLERQEMGMELSSFKAFHWCEWKWYHPNTWIAIKQYQHHISCPYSTANPYSTTVKFLLWHSQMLLSYFMNEPTITGKVVAFLFWVCFCPLSEYLQLAEEMSTNLGPSIQEWVQFWNLAMDVNTVQYLPIVLYSIEIIWLSITWQ